ncbi:hypothetical protein [Micromonospora halophytica]|uniref:von Hippel-Lindau disease tumour suppressor protein n=1 Tax=Micromonospora halophytica TaxID=47864 RepID=A0A1C5IY71_9ACTN|nr:hypothetical protein [Micromonospora halophytica]SCG63307.1 von Hippel-Lindau disease tumour suppressor protein [Micromonospora halophytica]
MPESPDDVHRTDPTLRIGGWLPESRRHAPPPPPHPMVRAHDGRHRAQAPPPASPPGPGGPTRTLVLGCVAVGVIATLVFALSPFWSTSPRPEDRPVAVPPTGAGQADGTEAVSATPSWTYSPAPVSLSTRASLPSPTRAASPTHQPTRPAAGTTTRPSPSPTPPRPPAPEEPRPDELEPLPPSQEPSLRSSSGGPETFVDFVNTRGTLVVVHWLDYGGQRQRYAVLQPGQGYRQQTYVGHPWVVTDGDGRGLVCFLPAREIKKAVIR